MRKNVAGQKVRFSLFKSAARIANPTIAAGDFKVDIDGGGQANVSSLPTSDAAGLVTWEPTQAETNGDVVTLLANDAAGDEWEPLTIVSETLPDTSIAAILADTAEIGVAGAGLTALGDARLANLDAAISTRGTADPGDAMALTTGERTTLAATIWAALTSALTAVGSIGKRIVDYLDAAISSRATLADVSCTVSLSETEAAEVATGSMALSLWGSFDQTIESDSAEDLSSADALIWAIKADRKRDADAEALVLVDEAAGLRYLARAAYTGAAANGSITLGGATGAWELRCQLTSEIPGELAAWANRNLDAQVKAIFGDRTVNLWEGTARIGHQTIREV